MALIIVGPTCMYEYRMIWKSKKGGFFLILTNEIDFARLWKRVGEWRCSLTSSGLAPDRLSTIVDY